MPQEVLLSPPALVDDVVALLREVGTPARRRGRVVIVEDTADAEPERRLELLFFLRALAISHPALAFELVESRPAGT